MINRFQVYRRKFILVLAVLVLTLQMFGISGCGRTANTETGTDQNESLVIATSFYPMYIMTQNITRDIPGVEVINVTGSVTGCLHDYQLTTNDLKRLTRAEVMVVNGAGMESFLDKIVDQRPDLKLVEASRGIALIKDEHGEGNPHVWVSISLAMKQVQNIADQLAALDPRHGSAYEKNAASYIKELEILRGDMQNQLADLPNRDIVTFHEAFPYFAREFGLNIAVVVEREPGSEPSAAELVQAVKIIRQAGVRAIFAEPQYPAKAARTIARETGAEVYTLDPVVTGPDDPAAYKSIMKKNLKVLVEALGDKE